ncbi:MAG: Holliday junction DNA helicase RuvB C-terminal domain-containing protein, partial [Patescibacteria group bacterium]
GKITKDLATTALKQLSIDEAGLDEIDRKILTFIIEKYGGGPVGLNTIAAAIAEEQSTLEDVYEPYLMQSGFLARTSRGRVVTESGYKHLGKEIPGNLQSKLV